MEEALKLINRFDFNLFEHLQSGNSIESIILDSTKGRIHNLLAFFLNITGVAQAIQYAIQLYHFEKNLKKKMVKQTAYPIFILLLSFCTIFLFSTYIIPQLMSNFEVDSNVLLYALQIIHFISLLMVIGMICAFLLLLLSRFENIIFSHIRILSIRKMRIVKELISFYISNYLVLLFQCGLSTKQSIVFLSQLKNQPLIQFVMDDIYDKLENGNELIQVMDQNPYLAKHFKMHFSLGSASNTFEAALLTYNQIQEQRLFQWIQRFSITIQVISYSFVGVLLICVYQIMLIPLQLLERM